MLEWISLDKTMQQSLLIWRHFLASSTYYLQPFYHMRINNDETNIEVLFKYSKIWMYYYETPKVPKKNFTHFLFFNIRFLFHNSVNQNLINVMNFGFLCNASNDGTSSFFQRGTFRATSGCTLTNLQAIDRSSNEIALFW